MRARVARAANNRAAIPTGRGKTPEARRPGCQATSAPDRAIVRETGPTVSIAGGAAGAERRLRSLPGQALKGENPVSAPG